MTDATPFLSPDSAASDASAAPGDRVLIHRLAGRDPEALAALYDRHIGAVFSLAARIVGDTAEAGRVVHEVFDQAWSDVDNYDGGRMSVGRWLLEMTRARAIARLRERETAAAAVTPAATAAGADTAAAAPAAPGAAEGEAPGVPGAAPAGETADAVAGAGSPAAEGEMPAAPDGKTPGVPGAAPAGETADAAAGGEAPETAAEGEAPVAEGEMPAAPEGETADTAEGEAPAGAASSEAATLRLPSPAQASAYDVYGPQEADRVRAALAGLPLLQRLGIELAYFEGLTLSQIAGRLEQSPDLINARIRSGLECIRAALEDPGE